MSLKTILSAQLLVTMCILELEQTIFGDLVVADNCIIAAKSVVTKSITQKNSIVGEIPAKFIKKNDYYYGDRE